MNHGLSATTLTAIRQVLSGHPEVERAILYGSRAKGNFKVGSDIDLVLVGAGLDHRLLLKVDEELDDRLLPYVFDLSLFSDLSNPDLIDHVGRIGVVLYERRSVAVKA
jgi:predicted nucleotidyltransferase